MTNARNVHCQQHVRHVGICPACQRARLAAEKQQLAEVYAISAAARTGTADIAAMGGDGASARG